MKFSVTIPAYKKRFLKEAIESVLEQTYKDFELIIVDDCSPENITSIVSDYSDERIRYYRNDINCGAKNVVDNWNICLGYCTGEYVLCMGDDDKLLPCCLEEYRKLIQKYPNLNIYHAKTQLINENSEIRYMQEARPEYESAYSMLYNLWTYKRYQFIGDFLYKTDYLRDNGGYIKFPYAFSSDWVTAYNAALKTGIANGQKSMFQYRISQYTISVAGRKDEKVFACKEVWDWYEQNLEGNTLNRLNDDDEIYKKLILDRLDNHFIDVESKMIVADLQTHGIIQLLPKIISYLNISTILGIPKLHLLKVIIKYLPFIILKIRFDER